MGFLKMEINELPTVSDEPMDENESTSKYVSVLAQYDGVCRGFDLEGCDQGM